MLVYAFENCSLTGLIDLSLEKIDPSGTVRNSVNEHEGTFDLGDPDVD